jgi:RND family efflux transporter MFP subunit
MKTRTKVLFALLPVALAAALILRLISRGVPAGTGIQGPVLVKVESPKRESVTRTLRLTGDVLPARQAQVFARVYGNVESIQANIGDYVHAGQVLARVDTIELAQQYREAMATYQNAAMIYERARTLQAQSLISKQEFDSVATSTEVARENSEAAKTRLDYAQIAAPFSGVITRRYLDAGTLLTAANATLFMLMDIETMKIMVNVLEKDIPSMNVGAKTTITVEAYPGREFIGSIVRLSQALDVDTRTMPVEIDVQNADHDLKPGMFARVLMFIGQPVSVLTIPTQALLKDVRGYYVLVADKDRARRVEVTIGSEQELRTVILSGLSDNDSLITTGQQFARDGGQISIQH